jgi:sec-independent protein translocase protein TatC
VSGATGTSTISKPFIKHVHELQMRLTWSVLAVLVFTMASYSVYQKLLGLVQRPLGQTLYYTSPTGGFSFLFKLCIVAGFIMALPVIIYNIFKFLGPLLHKQHRLSIISYTIWSFDLAYAGLLFAYFISLPAALHFLEKFSSNGVQSLITADEYFRFALAYIGGFALLFQLPIIVLFINKIKPLKPRKMMAMQRFVILFGFIIAAILTPTPDPINQLIMALPIVLLYQVAIVLVILVNKSKRHKPINVSSQQAKTAPIPIKSTHSQPKPEKPVVLVPKPSYQEASPFSAIVERPVRRMSDYRQSHSSRRIFDVMPPELVDERTM